MTQEQEAVLIDCLLSAEEALRLVHAKTMEECTVTLAKLNNTLAMMNVCELDAGEVGKGNARPCHARRANKLRPMSG